jgi:hypothetical protein
MSDYSSNHQSPNLIDNSIADNRFLEKNRSESEQISTHNNLQTTETDMMFHLLVNDEKMVSDGKEQFYDKLGSIPESPEYRSENSEDNDEYIDTQQYKEHDTEQHTRPVRTNTPSPPQIDPSILKENNNSPHNHESNGDEKLSPEQIKLMKLDMLRKLGELKGYGVTLSQKYNMNSDLSTMKYEYELHRGIRSKQNWVKWSSNVLLTCVHGLEMMNNKYDPFKLKLKGWSQIMNTEITSYYDVFGELYEKYNQPGEGLAPEVKLIMMIGGSAMKFHLMNLMLRGDFMKDREMTDELREKAFREQMLEQTKKQEEALSKSALNQHNVVTQNARDLEMLRHQEELYQKKREIEQLQEQIEQMSQYSSQQPIIEPPQFDKMNKPNHQELQRRQHIIEQRNAMKKNEILRQQQLQQQRQQQEYREQQELQKQYQNQYNIKSQIVDNVDDILSRHSSNSDKPSFGKPDDSESLLDETDTLGSYTGSKPTTKRRRKKTGIRISTS